MTWFSLFIAFFIVVDLVVLMLVLRVVRRKKRSRGFDVVVSDNRDGA